MAKSNIDLKDFFLKKGEKVGLVVAGLAMIGLCAGGVMAFVESESPTAISGDLEARAKKVEQWIQIGKATTSADLTQELKDQVRVDAVAINQYQCATEIFRASNPSDNKRRNPEVLGVVEWQADLIRGPVAVHDVIEEGGKLKLGVLEPLAGTTTAGNTSRRKSRYELWLEKQLKANPALARQMMPQTQPFATINQLQQMTGSTPEAGDKFRIVYKPADQLDGGKLASAMYPTRMVVVNASFPYEEQLEAFRRALRLGTIQDLLKEEGAVPQFLGVNVQRRTLKPGINLKEEDGWEDLDYDANRSVRWSLYRWMLSRAVEVEPEEERYTKTVIFNKLLVMPRPKMGRDDVECRYPELQLPTIEATLAKFEKSSGKGTALDQSPLMRKLEASKDIFETDEPKTDFRDPFANQGGDKKDKELFVPTHCLIRFVDLTVKAGNTYQYRIQVKLANPNYNKASLVAFPALAASEELPVGAWSPGPGQPPITVEVPEDLYYYAVEEKQQPSSQRDRATLQVQQWMESVRLDPANRASAVPIGDWVIGNVPVYRGETISRLVPNVDVLMYYPAREAFDLVKTKPRFGNQLIGISVDFTTPDLLVDFEGGQAQNYIYRTGTQSKSVTDSGSMEFLILKPDGKVQVRATGIDLKDSSREGRFDNLQSRVLAAKNRNPTTTGTGGIFGPR